MSKIWMGLMAGALGLVLLAGFAQVAQAQDDSDAPDQGGQLRGVDEEPAAPTEAQKNEHEKNRKECLGRGCKMPKCIHDWSLYKLNLTPEQKQKVQELRDMINKKTVGMNWCTRTAAKHRFEELKKQNEHIKDKAEKDKNHAEIEKAHAELKRINAGIEAGQKEFNETFKNKILNAEQLKKFLARQEAEKEHREVCSPKHHPSCPFYRKDNIKNEGRYIKYCQDEKHLGEGIFECPGYKDGRKDGKKEGNREEHKDGNKDGNKGPHQEKGNQDGDKGNSKK